MIWQPAEDVNYSAWQGQVDLIFTSPPYFDLERYSDDNTQSSVRYRSLDDWLESFLFKSLRRAVRCLKPDGHLVLNVANNATYGVQIVERAIEFVTAELGFRMRCVVPLLLSSKPGKDRDRVGWGRKVEPMVVFTTEL